MLPPEPEFHGGGYATEPGPDPFGFACWLQEMLDKPRTPGEMLATTPLHLLGAAG